jgi:hypothetical protein
MPVFIQTYFSDETLAGKTAKARHNKYIGTVLMAHNKAGRELANTIIIHHGRLPTNADGIHFNTEGQLKLGEMTAAAIAECYKVKQ